MNTVITVTSITKFRTKERSDPRPGDIINLQYINLTYMHVWDGELTLTTMSDTRLEIDREVYAISQAP